MAQLDILSKREQDVVNLLLEGKSNKLIASSLSISERTVEFHLKNIYDKFQVSSRVELVLKLGNSTVADEGKAAENEDGRHSANWFISLQEAVSQIGKELKMSDLLKSDAHDEEANMTFLRAILTCLAKYAQFYGRASRAEFWWFTLFVILVAAALTYLSEALSSIFLIAVLLPLLAAGTRRLHDNGRSGWWQLFLLVPVGGIVLVGILWALPSSPLDEE